MTPEDYEEQPVKFFKDFLRQVLARYLTPYLTALVDFFNENEGFPEVWEEIVSQIEEARRRESRACSRRRFAPTMKDRSTQTPAKRSKSTVERGCQTLPLSCEQQANQHPNTLVRLVDQHGTHKTSFRFPTFHQRALTPTFLLLSSRAAISSSKT